MTTILLTIHQEAYRARLKSVAMAALFLFVISWVSSISITNSFTSMNSSHALVSDEMSTSAMSHHCEAESQLDTCDSIASHQDCSLTHCSITGLLTSFSEQKFYTSGFNPIGYINGYAYLASYPPYTPPIALHV